MKQQIAFDYFLPFVNFCYIEKSNSNDFFVIAVPCKINPFSVHYYLLV